MKKYKYITFGKNSLSKENFNEIKNEPYFCKPNGGIWASLYTPNEKYLSSWQEFCESEQFGLDRFDKYALFNLSKDARTYTIDSLNDLKVIMKSYTAKPINISIRRQFLDYEKLSKDYDAIILTDKGQWETRMSEPNLYGWDVECILVLNFDVIEL
jgi:hypothetical protein